MNTQQQIERLERIEEQIEGIIVGCHPKNLIYLKIIKDDLFMLRFAAYQKLEKGE